MAVAGRKPNPLSQKKREGSKERKPKGSLSAPCERPPCPKNLSLEEKSVWSEITEELGQMKLLSRVDAHSLEMYSQNFSQMRRLQKFVRDKGETYEVETKAGGIMYRARPEVSILQRCRQMHKSLLSEFGLSPSARTRLPDTTQGNLFGNSPWGDY